MKHQKWIVAALAAALVAAIVAGIWMWLPGHRYGQGLSLRAQERWDEAIEAFTAAGGYGDAAEQITETLYRRAEALRRDGAYEEAYAVYLQIPGYRDTDDILAGDPHFSAPAQQYEEAVEPYKIPGNIVAFGHYEQDNDLSNGPEPIEWIVLEQREDRALLLSRYALDAVGFHSRRELITWDRCSLRTWLNQTFLSDAFDPGESAAVIKSFVDNSQSQTYRYYTTSSGSSTQDKVFLLSYAEAWKYFATNDERKAVATDYAKARGAYTSPINGHCWWWLRTSGLYNTCAINVHYDGSRGDYLVNVDHATVRPAVWVDLRSPYFSLSADQSGA